MRGPGVSGLCIGEESVDKTVKVDKTLDIKGLSGTRSKVLTYSTLEQMEPGMVLRVITNDVTTKDTIPSLCSEFAYRVLEIKEDGGTIHFIIQK